LSKMVNLPARAFVCPHPAAPSKTYLSPYLTGLLSTSCWNITLYIGERMSSQSCNDDAGLCPVHPLILLVNTHFATEFAQTFAQLPAGRDKLHPRVPKGAGQRLQRIHAPEGFRREKLQMIPPQIQCPHHLGRGDHSRKERQMIRVRGARYGLAQAGGNPKLRSRRHSLLHIVGRQECAGSNNCFRQRLEASAPCAAP